MKKFGKYFKIILICAVLFICSFTGLGVKALADENTVEIYPVLIIDEADILTPEEEEILFPYMTVLENYGNIIFRTVTLENGADYEKNSEDFYYENFKNEPGVIFQIDMGNRKLTLSASTGMNDVLAGERDSIVDNVYRYASDEDYLNCAIKCFDQINVVYNDGVIAHKMKYIDNAILAVLLSLIVNFVVIFATERKKSGNTQMLSAVNAVIAIEGVKIKKGKVTKEYSPVSSGSSYSGGGSSGGSGSGGGFSGGSSSHGF